MGWTVAGPAVEVHAGADPQALPATSTRTVALGARGLDRWAPLLRMYGVNDQMVARVLPDPGAWGPLVASNPCGLPGRVITFLDAPRRLFTPRFVIGPRAEGDAPPLASTCVPSQRRAVSWPLAVPIPGGLSLRAAALDVTYKDVAVLPLPDTSWLMVLARYRTRAAEPAEEPIPGRSLGDIVAWRAADPAFTVGVTGPYWLVDGRNALPGEARPAWLGVPDAVITGTGADRSLDLYFVVEADGTGGRSALDAVLAPSDGPRRPGTDGGQRGPQGQRRPPDDASGVPSGIAVKRFRWDTLLAQLDAPALPEAAWEAVGALPGELLGRVRLWAATETPGEVRWFETAFPGAAVHLVDPAPFACPEGGGAGPDLFVAAINATGPLVRADLVGGHGVWRAAAVPTGGSLCSRDAPGGPCTSVPTVSGRDFVVASGGSSSRDRVAGSRVDALYVDPDPVRLPGGVRVAVGDLATQSDGGLTWVAGTSGDVCRPWTDAWR